MGRTYTVPRNAKGESRILYIFTFKSMITTMIGALIGFIGPYIILSIIGQGTAGLISIAVCAVLGYLIGILTIPDSPVVGKLRKAGGEKITDIIIRAITFKKRKKLYVYREGGKKQWKY